MPHDNESKPNPTESARLARRIRQVLRRRNDTRGSETAIATSRDLATVLLSETRPANQGGFCGPWAA